MAMYTTVHNVRNVVVRNGKSGEHKWTVLRVETENNGTLELTLHPHNNEIDWTLPGVQSDE